MTFNDAPEQLVGTTFDGKYEILALLGQGGMSSVFKAKNLLMNKIVAIKILLGNRNLNEQALLRFQQEARAASQLDHPNIVKVHDFSVSIDHAPYMVMDYLEGKSISELISAEGQMDPYRAIDFIVQASDALEHAHQQGVVHRDLKPSNIMVIQLKNGREQIKIVDFGVAKLLEEDQASAPQLTRTGEVFGSPLYMSPEQCLGKKVDKRTDIYSLGCVLYEELAGIPPFRADNVLATMQMHISDPPPEITKTRADLHNGARLSSILLTALSKSPDQRYQSMQDFGTALREAALKPQSGLFGQLGIQFNIFRKTQKSGSKVPILVFSSIILLLLGVSIWWGWKTNESLKEIKDRAEMAAKQRMANSLVFQIKDQDLARREWKPTEHELEDYLRFTDPSELNIGDGHQLTADCVPLLMREPKLTTLYLRHANIDADGFKQITRALGKQLTKLSVSRNTQLKPEEIIEIFGNCTDLEHVSAQSIQTTDAVVASFAKFKNVKRMDISSKSITPNVFDNFPVTRSLTFLMINNAAIDGKTLRQISEKFPNLEELHIRKAKLEDEDLSTLGKLPLKRIWVFGCNFSKEALNKLKKEVGPGLVVNEKDYGGN